MVNWAPEASLPFPPLIIDRPDITGPLVRAIRERGIAVAHGGTGMGKTAVARLAAREARTGWNIMEFRDADPADTVRRLRS